MYFINKDLITVELAKFTLESFNHYQIKTTLGLMKGGTYITYTDDIKYKLQIQDNNFMLLHNNNLINVFHGPAHIICDKLRELYPVLKLL